MPSRGGWTPGIVPSGVEILVPSHVVEKVALKVVNHPAFQIACT